MNHATAAFQAQHHFVLRCGQGQQGRDFVAQAFGGRSLDIAIEIEHEHPGLGLGFFLLFLVGFSLGLAQGLELILVEQRLLQAFAQPFVEIIEFADLQLARRLAPPLAAQGRKTGQDHQNGDHQGHGLGQKNGVLGKKLHRDSSNDARLERARDTSSIPMRRPCDQP
ncbi:hypothetical protein D3C71_1369870 [compost metagenome]